MTRTTRYAARIVTGMLAVALTAPASAQTRADRSSAKERSAIHECSVRASKYLDYAAENLHMFMFRT